jgi:hypothetical protein
MARLLEDAPMEGDFERIAAETDLLAAFLQRTDFKTMRAQDAELSGGHRVQACLRRAEDGTVMLQKKKIESK